MIRRKRQKKNKCIFRTVSVRCRWLCYTRRNRNCIARMPWTIVTLSVRKGFEFVVAHHSSLLGEPSGSLNWILISFIMQLDAVHSFPLVDHCRRPIRPQRHRSDQQRSQIGSHPLLGRPTEPLHRATSLPTMMTVVFRAIQLLPVLRLKWPVDRAPLNPFGWKMRFFLCKWKP